MLKPRKRISKKQLKEDKLVTFYFKASSWLQDHTRVLTLGLAALVVVIVGATLYGNSRRSSEQAASVELARATRAYESKDYQNALTLLSNLVDSHGSTRSGKLGRLYLGQTFLLTNDYDNAQLHFEKFISSYKDESYLTAAAMKGVAACLEQKGDYAGAADYYQRAVKKYPKSILAPQLLLRAARCHALTDQRDQARALYDRIVADYPESQERDQALMLKSML